MAERKLDLPEDPISANPSHHSLTAKVEPSGGTHQEKGSMGSHEESKDQVASDSSIPLSPQWLYSKPNDSKMLDMRSPTSPSFGTSNDPSQKDGWRLDAPEDKKDWRRIATENEGNRRWREEERETGLLGARRDRRKTDRRTDSGSTRDSIDGRNLPSSDRWHDGSNRNSGHDARRDGKWSSRWGPEDKEKEARTEKKTDVEKEKEDAQNDAQSAAVSNRLASERESDSRDKWRPRHRMEVHSSGSGSSSYRAAPGFGPERGRMEVSNMGFAVGRGRSSAIGRSSVIGTGGLTHSAKSGAVIGKPNLTLVSFCYPRGKLLDIYRCQKLDQSLLAMPNEMEESPPITHVDFVEPLAFAAPDAEEDAVLSNIWKGKIRSSEATYNSFKQGRSTETLSVGDNECSEAIHGPSANEDVAEDAIYDANETKNESKVINQGGESQITADGLAEKIVKSDSKYSDENNAAAQVNTSESQQMLNLSVTEHTKFDDIDSTTYLGAGSGLQKHLSSSFVLGVNNEMDDLERPSPFDDLYYYYVDPQGNTQGPFQGADIISWFEQGYFGLDLPVCSADVPEGTQFQSLGEVMPHLKLRVRNFSSELDQHGAFGSKLEPGLSVANIPDGTDSSVVDNLSHVSSELNSFAESRISKSEVPLQMPHSEGQRFHDFVTQDEEVVFPGRLGSADSANVKPSGNGHDPLATCISHSLLSGDLREPSQSDSKLHPFGLLWSELQGSHARQTESSDATSSLGRAAPFGSTPDPVSVAERWSDSYRQDIPSDQNLFQDATVGRLLSHVEQEPSQFDIAEQLIVRQLQQQQLQQQQNMMSAQAYLNESLIERMPSQLQHQQLASPPARDIERLMAMQLQHQRQVQLQQQQLQQQHQLHQLQQQQLLQEQQESQVRQMLLEQLLHGQIAEPGLPQPHVDPIIANNALDKILLEQQLLHELQRSHHHPRHFVPSAEDLTRGKFGQVSHQDQQRDLLQLLSHAQHGQISPLEHQIIQQEQLLARQSSLGLRPRANMEEERHMGSFWPVNENDHLLRTAAANHRSHSSGISPLDFYQRQQRSSHEDQLSHLERNPSFQDQLLGPYDRASLPFDRSLSLPASGMNMDVANAIAHAKALDMQDLTTRLQSGEQLGTFSSGIPLQTHQHPVVPAQFHPSHLETNDGQWPESIGHQSNDWIESQMHHLRINERQNRELENRLHAKDLNSWMSDGLEDDKSRRLLMELLHQKAVHRHADSGQMTDVTSFEQRASSAHFSGSSSVDPPFSAISDRSAALSSSYRSNAFERPESCIGDEHVGNLEQKEKLPFRSETGLGFEGHSFLSGVTGATPQAAFADSVVTGRASVNKEYLGMEGKKHGFNIQGIMTKGSVPEVHVKAEQPKLASSAHGEMPANTLSRQSSISIAGIYNEKMGHQSIFEEDSAVNRVPLPSKGQNSNILLRRPPVPHTGSSQEGLPEVIPNPVARSKSSLNTGDGGMLANQAMETMESGKRDVRFRRTSSFGEAEMSEPSFIDMLKSNAKKTTNTPEVQASAGVSESSDAQGGRGGKKKGKKGKQIDPAFLGFKVTSNRIMMGEIQRIED